MERKNSQAKIDANNRYVKKAYDDVRVRVKKGERERIQEFAESQGMSLNGLINKLIYQAMGEEFNENSEQES